MQQIITIRSLEQLDTVAKKLLSSFQSEKVFAFYGEMGAGKTTFIKSICKQLGVKDNTSSPTFSIINEYRDQEGHKIYHFDFYRIKNESEIYDLGYEDYFYGGAFCFIEWPEKIEHLIPANSIKVTIQIKDKERIITING